MVPNMELLRKHLLREGHINKPELMELIAPAVALLSKSIYSIWPFRTRATCGKRTAQKKCRVTNQFLKFRKGAKRY